MVSELQKDLTRRVIKILDMGYSSGFYLLSAILCVTIINKITPKYDEKEEEKKRTTKLLFDILLNIWIIAIFAYIVRNIFHIIPWPLEGVYGYQHMRVKEVANSAVFVSFMVIFDKHLQSRIGILKKRWGEMY
jgi:hypothetical protein